ncbi:MAG: asparagine--tRNA ligase [Planctomycetes bacterium]|nr:asparagine--tRNA ligase [Planctomycetota bacterium]
MRIGLLGGSFNPPHLGHLAVARAVREAQGLDAVWLLPASRPPHKPGHLDMAPPQARLDMCRRTAAGEPWLEVCDVELERPGPSYTVDTLAALRARHPEHSFAFVIGGDTVGELPTWKDAARLLRETAFVVAARPGYRLDDGLAIVARELGEDLAARLREGVVTLPPRPESSTAVRRAILEGGAWEHNVTPEVADYIRANGLYRRDFVATSATVRELKQHDGQRVELQGWVYKLRAKGKLAFLHLRDGSGIVQTIVNKQEVGEEVFARIKTLTQEAAIRLRGTVKLDERAPGGVEVAVDDLEVVSEVEGEYPISLQAHGIDFLLSKRHLWLRSSQQHATLRVRSEVIQAIHDFFYARQFVHVDAPVFTPAACEGTTNLFEVKYFDDTAYLTQSGQLYMEAAAMAHGKVYCFGPTFRAERSKTRRHLTEFWMVEPEMAFAGLDDVMDLAEEFLESIVQRVLERCPEELATLERDTSSLERVKRPFPRVTYDEAVKLLQDQGHEFEWGNDFGAPDETAISAHFDRPVLVHRWPKAIKAFYMRPDPDDERLVLGVDVIAPEGAGEVIGGGERATDLGFLLEQIKLHELPQEAFEWYLDLRRYGSVPHGGFGLGLERLVAWICGREHVREAIPFPRTLYRKEP